VQQKTQQCVSSFYNSIPGKAVQFGSPLSLLPVWNPGWGNNLKEWGVAIVGKLGGLFGSGATPGTYQLTTLSGTQTVVFSVNYSFLWTTTISPYERQPPPLAVDDIYVGLR
jgi:hypothetical protein